MGERVLAGEAELRHSDEAYDWLGPGVYFWEGDAERAREWAEDKVRQGRYADAFVVGAVIDLGSCLDLMIRENIDLLKDAFANLEEKSRDAGSRMPAETTSCDGIGIALSYAGFMISYKKELKTKI